MYAARCSNDGKPLCVCTVPRGEGLFGCFSDRTRLAYFPWDNVMVLANVDAVHNGSEAVADHISVGVGGRYYITQNGLYLGAGVKLLHANHSYNDLMPGIELGYAFFVNRSVTIEPALYFDQSFKDHDYSTIGLKIGLGIYLFDD